MAQDTDSGVSRVQQFVTIVALLSTVIVVGIGSVIAVTSSLSDNRNVAESQCRAIVQLDANLRFYETAIASAKEINPPPALDLKC